ncbi:MBL fold metallo-hydrolase [Pontixanthobacter sp. CEM42]|uniref:MBL fold metallo-hydrolase n=1 Tax=Pontixanthobacter sp. CEM42 TaxID=2792077 RepID=UPI0032AFB596
MRKAALVFIGLIAVLAIAVFAFQAKLGEMLFQRAVEQNTARDSMADLSDGLHVGLCGTGSPMPNPDRAGPCNIVVAGELMFVVDIGEGGNRNIAQMGFNAADLDGVFLTHFHSDHVDGLGPLQLFHWTRGASTAPLPVYAPEGVEAVVDGFNAAYATDDTYRVAHHGETVVPSAGGGSEARPFVMSGSSQVVFEAQGLTVTAFTVDHEPVAPAVGYRFDYRGRSLCISGDTSKSANLERACKGVELLVHEALQPALVQELETALKAQGNANAAKIMFDIVDYHASPADAAESAQETGADMLVLTHLVPPLPSAFLYPAFLGDAENRCAGPIVVGEDGMFFSMPAKNDSIERSELL